MGARRAALTDIETRLWQSKWASPVTSQDIIYSRLTLYLWAAFATAACISLCCKLDLRRIYSKDRDVFARGKASVRADKLKVGRAHGAWQVWSELAGLQTSGERLDTVAAMHTPTAATSCLLFVIGTVHPIPNNCMFVFRASTLCCLRNCVAPIHPPLFANACFVSAIKSLSPGTQSKSRFALPGGGGALADSQPQTDTRLKITRTHQKRLCKFFISSRARKSAEMQNLRWRSARILAGFKVLWLQKVALFVVSGGHRIFTRDTGCMITGVGNNAVV